MFQAATTVGEITLTATQKADYQRRKQEGTLTLRGVVDIFEAAPLQAEAQRALHDEKATVISISLAQAERLDVAALQILIALRRDVQAAGRGFTARNTPPLIAKTVAELGLAELI
jgi:anti-anti-sigma regulatory factor